MKRLLIATAALAILPLAAFAGVTGTKHDLSVSSTYVTSTGGNVPVCKYCHTPHSAMATKLLWNHTDTAATTYTWATTTFSSGTPVPSAITYNTKKCFACHDGTVALGALLQLNGLTAATFGGTDVSAGKLIAGTGQDIVNPAAMDGNHPVSIPYPGSPAAYNGITTVASLVGYFAETATGCTSPSGLCTTAATNGVKVNLIKDTVNPTAYGIECSSCHDPHDTTNGYFLRVTNTGSAICLACHNK